MWGTAALTLALLAGAALVYLADRWRKRNAAASSDASAELTEFRRMYDRGEITDEEYARLRERVARRVKEPPVRTAAPGLPHLPGHGLNPAASLPGPDQPTPPPDPGKPANPASPS
jgi:hypothetical protein